MDMEIQSSSKKGRAESPTIPRCVPASRVATNVAVLVHQKPALSFSTSLLLLSGTITENRGHKHLKLLPAIHKQLRKG